jgi:hypothetical protein
MEQLMQELDNALYALNRAIFRAEDLNKPATVELLEIQRDSVWNILVQLDPNRKG